MSAGLTVHALYVINKSGGLVYSRNTAQSAVKLDVSDAMRLGSIWFSLHTISSQLSPVLGPCRGLKRLYADTFDLHCLKTMSGTMFFIVADASSPSGAGDAAADAILQKVHAAYADYVMKNPFYEVEMPIRCELFDAALTAVIPPRS